MAFSKEMIHNSWFKSESFSDSVHKQWQYRASEIICLIWQKKFDYQLTILLNMSDVHLGNSSFSEPDMTHQTLMDCSF